MHKLLVYIFLFVTTLLLNGCSQKYSGWYKWQQIDDGHVRYWGDHDDRYVADGVELKWRMKKNFFEPTEDLEIRAFNNSDTPKCYRFLTLSTSKSSILADTKWRYISPYDASEYIIAHKRYVILRRLNDEGESSPFSLVAELNVLPFPESGSCDVYNGQIEYDVGKKAWMDEGGTVELPNK